MVRAAIEAFGRIDIVVNNAGNQRNARFGEFGEPTSTPCSRSI